MQPLPQSLEALLWVIVVALAGAVSYLYRQNGQLRDRFEEAQQELLREVVGALSTVDAGMGDLIAVIEDHNRSLELSQKLVEIKAALDKQSQGGDQ